MQIQRNALSQRRANDNFHSVSFIHRAYFLKVFLPEPSGPTKNKNVQKMDPRTLDAFFEFQKYNLAPAENFGLQ
jgi:hypothetical protein